ncbi:MAG: hypothetical protein M1813_000238 [Trichoglossum hirsutum]|nr:MAG: hypothetical protein M1813_000238 [Trichoglossum hirsutum]
MPSVPIRLATKHHEGGFIGAANPLPQLLQTPSGLAILELQGTINLPPIDPLDTSAEHPNAPSQETPIGRLVFPEYSPVNPPEDTAWMKRVYLYVGKHQRLTGEVKKLSNPTAVIRRRECTQGKAKVLDEAEELEIVEIVRWKILFSQRPEPVGN